MNNAGTSRLIRALQTSSVALGVVVACTVVDKDDYTFRDGDAGAGGESTDGGTAGKGGTAGTAGKGGTSGTAGKGGSSGKGGSAGAPGEGGDAGAPGGAPGEGGMGGQPGGECGDGTQDPGEDCDDGNRVDEECDYFATACTGCSSSCRRIRPPSCGDGAVNGARPTSIYLQYLATECTGVTPAVPLYLNGVLIPTVPWGATCLCLQPAPAELTITDAAVLDAVRQDGNVLTFLGNSNAEYLAWANMTIAFDNGARLEKVAFDFGPAGDAQARNLGYPPDLCPIDFFGPGTFAGAPFGGYPVEHCDGGADCYACSVPQCVTMSSTAALAIPDYVGTAAGVVLSPLTLPEVGTVRDVDVTINVTHTYDADLGISIVSPFNSVSLAEFVGGGGDNFTDTVFDSACPSPIATGVAPFAGCYAPTVTLDTFNGFARSFGPWNLRVQDNVSNDTGTLNSWKIKVCGAP
jgi:subtilisin-like proprotein convertase family protein